MGLSPRDSIPISLSGAADMLLTSKFPGWLECSRKLMTKRKQVSSYPEMGTLDFQWSSRGHYSCGLVREGGSLWKYKVLGVPMVSPLPLFLILLKNQFGGCHGFVGLDFLRACGDNPGKLWFTFCKLRRCESSECFTMIQASKVQLSVHSTPSHP